MENLFENTIFNKLSHDVAMDLGTSTSYLLCKNADIKIEEPSYIAYHLKKKEVVAIGASAKAMLGRTPPEIKVIKPIKSGVIGNFEMASVFIDYLLKKVKIQGFLKPRIMLSVPVNSSEVERRAIQETLRLAGARSVYLIEQVIASAIGSDIPIMEPYGGFIVNYGATSCQVSLLSLGGIVMHKETPIAGEAMDEAIAAMLRRKYNLLIGENTAENLKKQLGSAVLIDQETNVTVKGRDISSGLPACVSISSADVAQALEEPLRATLELVKSCIELAPHEIIADIINKGIVISGAIAHLRGLDRYFYEKLNVKCSIAPDPSYSTALGMIRIFKDTHLMKTFFANTRDRIDEIR